MLDRNDDSLLAKWWTGIDKPLFLMAMFLIVIGGLMVISASPYSAIRSNYGEYTFIKKYLAYLLPGLAAMALVSGLGHRNIRRLSYAMGAAFLPMLAATLTGPAIKGSRRWINLGIARIQPSEFLKPALAVIAAMLIIKIKDAAFSKDNKAFWRNAGYLAAIFVGAGLILLMQPDKGMTLAFAAILMAEAFVAGLPYKLVCAGIGIIAAGLAGMYRTSTYFARRIDAFLFPGSSDTYQIDAGLAAIRQAGLFGGHTNNLKQNIPDVHTDFIFSAMVEEFGVLLAILVVAVFFMLGFRIFSKIAEKKDPFAVLSATGIASCLMFQVCVNLGSNLRMGPTKGMTLPFISYGGSSFVSSCIGIGMVLALLSANTSRRRKIE